MSAAGAWLAKLVGAAGGAPTVGALVVGGLLVGALGGAFAGGAFGRGADVPADGELAIYPCPETGPVLAVAGPGQRMLVTGRTADGAWLRIHFPTPGRDEAWVQADSLRLVGELDSVELAECAPETAVSTGPSALESMTAIGSFVPTPSPTPKPSTPPPTAPPTAPLTPTPVPTPTDSTPPTLGNLAAQPPIIYSNARCGPTSSTITVTASDPESGITSVVLYYRPLSSTGPYSTKPMSVIVGGPWGVVLDYVTDGLTATDYTMFAQATNGAGLTSDPSSGRLIVKPC